jgi:hypothetical protein
MTASVVDLLVVRTAATLLARGYEIFASEGVDTSNWRVLAPTRILLKFLATMLGDNAALQAYFVRSGFLSQATGAWLKVLAWEVYGVDAPEATHAAPTVTLMNAGGGRYFPAAGDLTVKSAVSGQTYHSTDAVALVPGGPYVVSFVADAGGSEGSVGANEIDTMVTTLLGVSIVSSTAAVGTDEPSPEDIRTLCRATLGALSPNGPPDAYDYVARTIALSGTPEVTRTRVIHDSDTGDVIAYLGGTGGGVSSTAVALVQTAFERWAAPLCITPEAVTGVGLAVDVTAIVTGDGIPATYVDAATAAVSALIAAATTGVTRTMLIGALTSAATALGATNIEVGILAPAASIVLADDEFAIEGTITIGVV